MNKYLQIIIAFFTKGHKRTLKAKKHVLFSVFFKGISIAINFVLVPVVLSYIGQEKYGVWLTVSSIIGFATFFDLGLGNGLRNLYTKAIAEGDDMLAKAYVSTGYVTITIIMVVVYVLYNVVNPYVDWQKILNTSAVQSSELSLLVSIVVAFFLLRFIFNLIGIILMADQRPAVRNAFGPIANILSFIAIIVLTRITTESIIYLGVVYSVMPVLVLVTANFYFFSTDYNKHVPSIKFFKVTYIKDLLGLGIRFFILQLGAIVLMSTDNIIITQLFGPGEVVVYQLALKYMGLPMMLYTILLSPIWSACTEAYHKGDIIWIKSTIKGYEKIALLFMGLTVLMALVSNVVYKLWVGVDIKVPLLLTISWGVNSCLLYFGGLYTNFLNGIGKVNLSIVTAVFTIILNIPLSIFLGKYCGLGLTGVVLATNISVMLATVTRFIQYNKIVNKRAIGIWNK